MDNRTGKRTRSVVAAVAAALVVTLSAACLPLGGVPGGPTQPEPSGPKPTVVLVHGAWADASGWGPVIKRLKQAGYPVIAPANPLRSLAGDAAYVASVIDQTPGPIVLVGHSYGGAVITNAATGNPRVKALVYISGYIPDVGEDILSLTGSASLVPTSLEFRGIPPFGEHDTDAYLAQSKFRSVFAADLPSADVAVLAATQRPLALAAASAPTETAAWKSIPSWALISANDKAIDPAQLRFMARRANSTIVEVPSSHASLLARPDAVTRLITDAARATA